jgi:hypothetical protein
MRLALASGMSRGEVAACEANFRSLLSSASPFLYSSLYSYATASSASSWLPPGLPYLVCLAFLCSSHVAFCTLPPESLDDGGGADSERKLV